ncbi:MAG: hypothetical protein AB4426_28800 [Xenococcaceae cyanobacterium]
MGNNLFFELLEDPTELAGFQGWSKEVYQDLLAIEGGRMSAQQFDHKYLTTQAILVLDLAGFTSTAIREGCLVSFLRILDAQKVCLPVLKTYQASFIRTFADDIVALFEGPDAALDAAFEIHRRMEAFTRSQGFRNELAECCVGIGYGAVYRIGPNLAMGDEMNRASKLGEDTARGGETLVTEGAYNFLKERPDIIFESQVSDDLLFPYFRARWRG